jgi:hypothetical protein
MESGSPNGRVVSVSKSKTSVFEKLNALADEISDSIRGISDQPKAAIDEEIMQMKNKSYRERLPEVEFVTLLFRKYADLSSGTGSKGSGGPITRTAGITPQTSELAGISMTNIPIPVPTKVIDLVDLPEESERLSGCAATNSSLFKLRAIATFFSFLSWVIITATPGISQRYLTAKSLLSSSCSLRDSMGGGYHMGAFQAAQAAGILIFIHSFVYVAYYMMPINESTGYKYIPYLREGVTKLVTAERYDRAWNSAIGYFVMYRKPAEFAMDTFLVVYTALVTLIGSIMIDRSAQMGTLDGLPTYFTLGTFYQSFR